MSELSIEEFTRIVVRILETSNVDITLEFPSSDSPFPLGLVTNPMKYIRVHDNNNPVLTRFSIDVEWWTDKKYTSMQMFENASNLLREYNFKMVGGIIDIYDEVTRKHRYGARYEVNYNGLTDSFEMIR